MCNCECPKTVLFRLADWLYEIDGINKIVGDSTGGKPGFTMAGRVQGEPPSHDQRSLVAQAHHQVNDQSAVCQQQYKTHRGEGLDGPAKRLQVFD
jgi:hypothetical protein